MSNRFSQLLTTLFFLLVTASSLSAQTAENRSAAKEPTRAAYLDPSLPLEQRVNDLVSRMTFEEKVSQMQDVAAPIPRLGIPASAKLFLRRSCARQDRSRAAPEGG